MKRVFTFVVALLLVGCLSAQMLVPVKVNDNRIDVKSVVPRVLVAYFSYSGQTEYVAQRLALYAGADLYRIEVVEPYPEDRDLLVARAKKEIESKEMVKLAGKEVDLEKYDVVFIGSPVWCGQWNMAALNFASDRRLNGKRVIPFLTAGRDNSQLLYNIREFANTSDVPVGFCLSGDQLKKENEVDMVIFDCLKRNKLAHKVSFGNVAFTDMAVLRSIENMLARYPKITLCDIYKSYYQDAFGPGHMILSAKTAMKAIKDELKMSNGKTVGCEPTGALGRYTRVDLAYVKDKKIKIDDYVDLVMSGVTDNSDKDMKEWEREWNFVMSVIERYNIRIEGYDNDRETIMNMWKNGNYVMHHSSIFNESYNPHYRLIPTDSVRSLGFR